MACVAHYNCPCMAKLTEIQRQRLRRLRTYHWFGIRAFLAWPAVIVVTMVGFVGFDAEIWLAALPFGYITLVWMPIVFAQFVFWRCPFCRSMLGRGSDYSFGIPSSCPRCGCNPNDLDK